VSGTTTGTATTGTATGTAATSAMTGTAATPQTQTPAAAATAAAQVDEEAARRHLTQARNTLSELTQLPAAAQLSGEARTHISQLISNFNELITTQAEWRASYDKVEANLTALLGPDPGATATGTATGTVTGTTGSTTTTGTVGTSGTATANLDPAVRQKLIELRRHLAEFEKAAGGSVSVSGTAAAGTTGATASGTVTGTASGTTTGTTATGTTGTTGTTTAPTATGTATGTAGSTTGQAAAGTAAQGHNHAEIMRHVAAIETLLKMEDEGGGLTLTKAQVEQLRTHWAALKQLLDHK